MTDTKRIRTRLQGSAAQAGYLTGQTQGDLHEVRLDTSGDPIWLKAENFDYEQWEPQISFTADGADTPEQAAQQLLTWIREAQNEDFYVHVENGHGEVYVVQVTATHGELTALLDIDNDTGYRLYRTGRNGVPNNNPVPVPDAAWIGEVAHS